MRLEDLEIDQEIARARTLPGWVYRSDEIHAMVRERVFARSWQFVREESLCGEPGSVWPFEFARGSIGEPLILARDRDGQLRCLSNVCTHRANLLIDRPGACSVLRCRYHGRRFELNGRFRSMPEFDGVVGFPGAEDDLAELPLGRWNGLLFAALDPEVAFDAWSAELQHRLEGLALSPLVLDPARSRDYTIAANWALYCDNYLEGFHIPFVHPSLAEAIEYDSYRTELFQHGSVQIAQARPGEPAFERPEGHPDAGRRIAAYYFWLFPSTMVNVYPWGVSMNVVLPIAVDRTVVSFLTFVARPEHLDAGAGSGLDRVEQEDERIVEACQLGVGSRLYRRGRYSPSRERGIHQFHRMLVDRLRRPQRTEVSDAGRA